MHDVVVIAVRKAVSAATIIFTAISINRFFIIVNSSIFQFFNFSLKEAPFGALFNHRRSAHPHCS